MKKLALVFVVIFTMFGCSHIQTYTTKDHEVNFKKIKTFNWAVKLEATVDKTGTWAEPSVDLYNVAKTQIMIELQKNGINLNEKDPDVFVNFFIIIKNEEVFELNKRKGNMPEMKDVAKGDRKSVV